MDEVNNNGAETFAPVELVKFGFRNPNKVTLEKAAAAGLPMPVRREALELPVPRISFAQLSQSLQDAKCATFVLALVHEAFDVQARAQIDDTDNPVMHAGQFRPEQCTIEYLSSLTKQERASSTSIDLEDRQAWANAVADWKQVQSGGTFFPDNPIGTNKRIVMVNTLANMLPKAVRVESMILNMLKIVQDYFTNAPTEEVTLHEPVIRAFVTKAEGFLKVADANALAAQFS